MQAIFIYTKCPYNHDMIDINTHGTVIGILNAVDVNKRPFLRRHLAGVFDDNPELHMEPSFYIHFGVVTKNRKNFMMLYDTYMYFDDSFMEDYCKKRQLAIMTRWLYEPFTVCLKGTHYIEGHHTYLLHKSAIHIKRFRNVSGCSYSTFESYKVDVLRVW